MPEEKAILKNVPIPVRLRKTGYQNPPTTPKWRQMHEENEAQDEDQKQEEAKWQDWIKKRHALDLFHRLWEKNRRISAQRRRKMVQDAKEEGRDPSLKPYVHLDKNTPDPRKSITKPKRKLIDAEKAVQQYFPTRKCSKTSVLGIPKGQIMSTPFGIYREARENRQTRMIMPTFDRMLKNLSVPEHHQTLKSRHQIDSTPRFKRDIEMVYKNAPRPSKHVDFHEKEQLESFRKEFTKSTEESPKKGGKTVTIKDDQPQFSKAFGELLKSKKFRIPEHHTALRSHHHIKLKSEISAENSQMTTRSSEPDWSLWAPELAKQAQRSSLKKQLSSKSLSSKRRKSSDKIKNVKPKFTQDFRKMLKGVTVRKPELHTALTSLHNLVVNPKKGHEKQLGSDDDSFSSDEVVLKTGTSKVFPDKKSSMSGDVSSIITNSSLQRSKRLKGHLKTFSDYIRYSKPDLLLHRNKNKDTNPSYLADTSSLQSKRESRGTKNKSLEKSSDIGKEDFDSDNSVSSDKSGTTEKRDAKRTTYNAMKISLKKMESIRSVLLDPTLLTSPSNEAGDMDLDAIIREKRKAVMDSIKNFSKVGIAREDYRPPREERNFIQENIENIRKMSRKITEASKGMIQKGPDVFATHYFYLPWYQSPKRDQLEESQYGFSLQNITDSWAHPIVASMKPMRIRRYSLNGWRNLMEQYWEKIKLLRKDTSPDVGDGLHKKPEKCDCCVCYTLAKGNISY